ncbi:MAG: hypothetical protein B6D46_11295 [Polyangiaceae bacterium UTPRO1]|nr:MAG: hypothetical protein B6D46_11295 [Polyangiaceae bacterium UTPRO1]
MSAPRTSFTPPPRRRPARQRVRTSRASVLVVTSLVVSALLSISVSTRPQTADAEVIAFDPTRAYPVGINPKGLSVGDCDGDGLADVVVAAQGSGELVVLRNVGDGTLEFGGGKTQVAQPVGAACGDFNGDGITDLAAVGRDGKITFYAGDGTGGFTDAGTRPAGVGPTSMVAADLNGDGHLDLLAVASTSQDATILLGTGTSALPLILRIRLPIDKPRAAAVADFDGDGRADIAIVGAEAPYIVVLYGDGIGFATRPTPIPEPFAGKRPTRGQSIAAADFDGDGRPDLAMLSDDHVVTLFIGRADGSFGFLDAFGVSSDAQAIALGDLNGDGVSDLVVLSSVTNSVQVFRATGHGAFALRPVVANGAVSNALGPVTSRTILGDPADAATAITQLLVADGAAKAVTLVEQGEAAKLLPRMLLPLADLPVAIALGDVDGDGIDDAAMVTQPLRGRRMQLRMLLGTTDGGFADVAASGRSTCGNGILEGAEQCDDGNTRDKDGCSRTCTIELGKTVVSLAFADLDGDGLQDLVVVDDRGRVSALFADGHGRIRAVRSIGIAKKRIPAAVADFTGDDIPDVIFPSRSRRSGALTLASNRGDGSFTLAALPVTTPIVGPLLAGDFDRNGFVDLAVGTKGGWSIRYNDGDGPVRGTVVPLAQPSKRVLAMTAADFDEDGWLDLLATVDPPNAPAQLFRGGAVGMAANAEPVKGVRPLSTPFTVDLDRDSHQDLVSCSSTTNLDCLVLYGDGRGKFGPAALPASSAIGREPRAAAAADFDGDGFADVVGISRRDHQAIVLFGGPASATSRRVLSAGMRPSDVTVLDLNDDGRLDIVVANEGSRDLSIFLNGGSRQFLALAPIRLPSVHNRSLGLIALAAGDINGDGLVDLAAVQAGGREGGVVTTFVNFPGIGLAATASLPVGNLTWGVALGQLNGDGVLDIVTANRSDDTFSVLLSQPDGGYTRTDYASGGGRPTDVAVADVNGDGLDDVIVANERVEPQNERYGSVVTFANDGAGGFGGSGRQHVRGRESPRGICAGDFDGDGRSDVAVASLGSSDVMVLFGSGDGGWRADERVFPAGGPLSAISCNDADGDGRTDIAFGRRTGSEVGLILTGP